MKLRAEIVVEVEAGDFIAAAGHQTAIEDKFGQLRQLYPGAVLKFRQARETSSVRAAVGAAAGEAAPGSRMHRPTGALNTYED